MKFFTPFFLPALVFGVVACSSPETNGDEKGESETIQVDSLVDLPTGEPQEMSFEMIEDYALISSRTELYETFDEENLTDDTAWYAEGTLQLLVTDLVNPENGAEVRFVWNEEDWETLNHVEASYILYDENYEEIDRQRIESESGMYTGMPLTALEVWNGQPVSFSGFGWDYGGSVFSEEGGMLEISGLDLILGYDNDVTYDEIGPLLGDVLLTSDQPKVAAVPIYIGEIIAPAMD